MAERIQKKAPAKQEQEQVQEELDAKVDEEAEKLKAESDALIDEIDLLLESNAEEFVKNYIQKGGQ